MRPAAELIVLDPLYSTHDQAENDTRAMAALCQSLLRLREASRAALIVVHRVRKSIGRYEIGYSPPARLPRAGGVIASRISLPHPSGSRPFSRRTSNKKPQFSLVKLRELFGSRA